GTSMMPVPSTTRTATSWAPSASGCSTNQLPSGLTVASCPPTKTGAPPSNTLPRTMTVLASVSETGGGKSTMISGGSSVVLVVTLKTAETGGSPANRLTT